MSVKVMGLVWDAPLSSPSEKLVLLAYADKADHEGGRIFPSVSTMVRVTMLCERSVRSITKKLIDDGLLVLVHQGGRLGPRDVSEFRIDMEKLAKVAFTPAVATAVTATAVTATPVTDAVTPAPVAYNPSGSVPPEIVEREEALARVGAREPERSGWGCEEFHTGGSGQVDAVLRLLAEVGVEEAPLIATRAGISRLILDFGYESVMRVIPGLAQQLLGLKSEKNAACRYIAAVLKREQATARDSADRWPLVAKRDEHFEAKAAEWEMDDPRGLSCFTMKQLLARDGKPFTGGSKKVLSLYHLDGKQRNLDSVWPADHRPFRDLVRESGLPQWLTWAEFQSQKSELQELTMEGVP